MSRAVLAWRDFQVSNYDDAGQVAWAHGAGIEVLRGHGRLAGPRTVTVDGTAHTADHIVVATGSDPAVPPISGLRDLPGLWTDREVTGLTEVPRRLLVLGGGPIGVEMAQAVSRLGASVTVVERGDRLLSREPRRLGEGVAAALRTGGVELRLGQAPTAARLDGDEYVLELADGTEARGDRLLVATGRRPRVADLGLETVGITADPRGIPVDARMSAGPGLWAIGDVTGLWLFTHVGEYQGRVVASNILGRPREADYDAVPRVIFIDPQAAAVGAADGPFTATDPAHRRPPHLHVHPGLRHPARLPDPRLRRRAPHRRLRPGAGGGRVAPAGDPGDPGARSAGRAARRHPAVPDLLRGDLARPARPRRPAHLTHLWRQP